jgi:hypothetical protein
MQGRLADGSGTSCFYQNADFFNSRFWLCHKKVGWRAVSGIFVHSPLLARATISHCCGNV